MSQDIVQAVSRSRVVLVTRKTRLEVLLAVHGTLGQSAFYLESRGQRIEPLLEQQASFDDALRTVQQAFPADQRRVRVERDSLDRFLFAPDDIVFIVGQDGLVPNTAKYLRGQLTIGVNPDPATHEGVLCPFRPEQLPDVLEWLQAERQGSVLRIEKRCMARALREDGQQLLALNELFIGHRTHQSARYRLRFSGIEERQSSSGIIVSTGTGSSGWARSIVTQRNLDGASMPEPEEARLAWFVREPWPSVSTMASLSFGFVRPPEELSIFSEMGDGGVIFADGVEHDRLEFAEGQSVSIGLAQHQLKLVLPAHNRS